MAMTDNLATVQPLVAATLVVKRVAPNVVVVAPCSWSVKWGIPAIAITHVRNARKAFLQTVKSLPISAQ